MLLTPQTREISAFVTPDAFLQYTVMPFGVCNVPATFQRTVLSGLSGCEIFGRYCGLSSSWDDHIQQIQAVFERLMPDA